MSTPAPLWWRVIKAILWLLFRLVALALTGQWIRGRQPAEDGSDEEDTPLTQQALSAPLEEGGPSQREVAAQSGTQEAGDILRRGHAVLLERTRELREGSVRLRHGESIRQALARVDEQLSAIWAQLASTACDDAAVATELRSLGAALTFLANAIEERQDESTAAWLAEADHIGADTLAPVEQVLGAHGTGFAARVWVASARQVRERHVQAMWASPLGPLKVEAGLQERPDAWPLIAGRVARSLFVDVPQLADELYGLHGFPAGLPLPHSHQGYGPDEVHAALGAWLEPLFCDVYAATRLGPGYAHALAQSLRTPGRRQRAAAASARGNWLSPIPPPVVRVQLLVRVLEELGHYQDAEQVLERWESEHGEAEQVFLPTGDGAWNSLPLAYVMSKVDTVVESLLREPIGALSQQSLLQVPGLAFVHSEQGQQERLRQQFAADRGESHAPHVVVTAAALAVLVDGVEPGRVSHVARRFLGVRDRTLGHPDAYALPDSQRHAVFSSQPGAAPKSIAQAMRDRAILRDAIALGAALGPRRAQLSRAPRR